MPRRAVELCLEARVHVELRSAPPFFAARDELQLDHSLGAEIDLQRSRGILAAEGDDDAERLAERCLDLGLEDDLREVGRADLLFALADEHEVHWELLPRGLEGMQGGEESGLRALGIRGPASNDDLPEAGLVHEPSLERWRAPLGGVELLDVIHEIDA